MKGSEKQIKWAEDIKAGAYRALDSLNEMNNLFGERAEEHWKNFSDTASPDAIEAVRKELDALFSGCDDARMIINNRAMMSSESILRHCRDWMNAHK